jgi:hypothetical protein
MVSRDSGVTKYCYRLQMNHEYLVPGTMRFLRTFMLPLLAACTRADVPASSGGETSAAIDSGLAIACSAEARPGLTLTASDARTGVGLAGYTAVLRTDSAGAADPVTLDSVTVAAREPLPPPPITWAGASERAGRYAVRVTKAGYIPWDTANVVVTADRCHVQTVHLVVRLEPK